MTFFEAHTEALRRCGLSEKEIKNVQAGASMDVPLKHETLHVKIVPGEEEKLITELVAFLRFANANKERLKPFLSDKLKENQKRN